MTSVEIETVELVEPWLYATLHGDATLNALVDGRITSTLSPLSEGVEVPLVNFTLASNRDVTTANGVIIENRAYYHVKGIALGDTYTGALLSIAKRIHQLIQGAQPTFSPQGSLTCTREGILQFPETVQAMTYRHLGGTYDIRCNND